MTSHDITWHCSDITWHHMTLQWCVIHVVVETGFFNNIVRFRLFQWHHRLVVEECPVVLSFDVLPSLAEGDRLRLCLLRFCTQPGPPVEKSLLQHVDLTFGERLHACVCVCERFWSFHTHLNTSDKSIYRVYKTGSATPTCTAFRLSLMCILSTSDSGTCKKQNKGIHGYKVSMVLISLLGEWQLRYHIHIVCSFPRTKKQFSDWLVVIQTWHVKNAIKCGNITPSSDFKNCIRPSG